MLGGRRAMRQTPSSVSALVAVALIGTIAGAHTPVFAGSDHTTDTYAGDYQSISLIPPGTFTVLQYLRYAHADAFVDTAGQEWPNSHANIFVEFTRLSYITQVEGHPFSIEADLPFATLTNV